MSAEANIAMHRLSPRIESLRAAERAQREAEERVRRYRALVAHGLRDLRVAHGLSLRQLAPHAGCTAATLHDLEHCRRWSERVVMALFRFYGVRP